VSAISGTGTGEMLDALLSRLPPPASMDKEAEADKPLAIAIVGRPNVGVWRLWLLRSSGWRWRDSCRLLLAANCNQGRLPVMHTCVRTYHRPAPPPHPTTPPHHTTTTHTQHHDTRQARAAC
jgi:hypothetical protein